MTVTRSGIIPLCAAGALAIVGLASRPLQAADAPPNPIKEAMSAFHKAPKGVDPVCKRVTMGKVTDEEMNHLVAAYKKLAAAKPPKGDEKSWQEKASRLLAATEGIQKGQPGAVEKYKEAVNCKACHTDHKPD